MAEDGHIPIRSFRVVFKLERRVHKIDNWRIPLPFGIPLRGVGYAAALLFGVLVVDGVPGFGALLRMLPPPVRYAMLPIAMAYIFTIWEFDGRPAHATAIAFLRMRVLPRRLVAFRAAPRREAVVLGAVTIAPDERAARLRPARITGPADVVLRYPVAVRTRRGTLRLTALAGPPLWRGKQVHLAEGQRVTIR